MANTKRAEFERPPPVTQPREYLIAHLTDQELNTVSRIQDRLAALDGASELKDEDLKLLDELSELSAELRLWRNLLDRLRETDDVRQAYSGLMAARLTSFERQNDHYMRMLGEEAYFAGLGPGIRSPA